MAGFPTGSNDSRELCIHAIQVMEPLPSSRFGMLCVSVYIHAVGVCRFRGSAEMTRQASNCITVLLREQDKDFDGHLSKKTSLPGSTSIASAPTTSTVTTVTDTMSSIGTFSIADFIVTTQVWISIMLETVI